MSETPPRETSGRALVVYAWTVLTFMVLVVLWGAVVRATGSGAGCGNHWPLCNGDFVPLHPRLATIIEFTHRSMSGFLTGLVAVLVGWVFWREPRGDGARRASVWVAVLLVTEALLGAVLVKGGYVESNVSNARVAMQCIHFTNTMLLLAALTVTAWRLGRRATPNQLRGRLLATTTVCLTLVVGATGSVAALADTLFPAASFGAGLASDFSSAAPLLVRMRWVHPAFTILLTVAVLLLHKRNKSTTATLVSYLLCFQILCGIMDVFLLAPTWMQIVHLLGADLFWISVVVLATQAFAASEIGLVHKKTPA